MTLICCNKKHCYKDVTNLTNAVYPHFGFVVQLVRTLPCHGRGHGFESRRSRQRSRAAWKLAWLITKRSLVQIQPPQPAIPYVRGLVQKTQCFLFSVVYIDNAPSTRRGIIFLLINQSFYFMNHHNVVK